MKFVVEVNADPDSLATRQGIADMLSELAQLISSPWKEQFPPEGSIHDKETGELVGTWSYVP